ncbi:MAG TPA: pilus assembly protein PilP [bacterium]|nr:pilus assembly protein PilP [bacterium]
MRSHKLTNGFALGCLLLGVIWLAACGGQAPAPGPSVPKENVAPTAAKEEPAPSESKAKETVQKEWHYDATDKWDPFAVPEPPVITEPSSERYDLDQMTLLGIIRGSNMDAAYVRMPDGTDKIVRVGDILGKHGGEIKEIGKDSVTVEERYMDPKRPNDTFIIEKELKLAGRPGG